MTFVEYLAGHEGKPSNRERVLAAMYFSKTINGVYALAPVEVRELLVGARVPKARTLDISKVLARAGHYVNRDGGTGSSWQLTDSGRDFVQRVFGRIESGTTILDARTLHIEGLVSGLSDDVVRSYLDEAVRCLAANALRAAVVFVWSGAMRTLEEAALASQSGKVITAALRKHDTRSKSVSKVGDFASTRDATKLLAFQDLGLLDKSERQILEDALNLRNKCGHPTKYVPREAKVDAFVEDVIGVVFS